MRIQEQKDFFEALCILYIKGIIGTYKGLRRNNFFTFRPDTLISEEHDVWGGSVCPQAFSCDFCK